MADQITVKRLNVSEKVTSNDVDTQDIKVDGVSIKNALKNIPPVFVKTVNGNSPDPQTGNVVVDVPAITVDSELSLTSENPAQNKVITAAINKKVDGVVGQASIFNEADGGGAMFDSTTGVKSFVGVNDPTTQGSVNGIAGQLYVVNSNENRKTKLNMYDGKFCYVKGDNPATEEEKANSEIVVKSEIAPATITNTVCDNMVGTQKSTIVSDGFDFLTPAQLGAIKMKLGMKVYPVSYTNNNLSKFSWPIDDQGNYESDCFYSMLKTDTNYLIGTQSRGVRILENGADELTASTINYAVSPEESQHVDANSYWRINKIHCLDKMNNTIVGVQTLYATAAFNMKNGKKFDSGTIGKLISESGSGYNTLSSDTGVYYSTDNGATFNCSYHFNSYIYARRVINVCGLFIVPLTHQNASTVGNNKDFIYSKDGINWKEFDTVGGCGFADVVKVSENQFLLLPSFSLGSSSIDKCPYLVTIPEGEDVTLTSDNIKKITTNCDAISFSGGGVILVARYYDVETKTFLMFLNGKLFKASFNPSVDTQMTFEDITSGLLAAAAPYLTNPASIGIRCHSISKHFNTYYICFNYAGFKDNLPRTFAAYDYDLGTFHVVCSIEGTKQVTTDMYSEGTKLYQLSNWSDNGGGPRGTFHTGIWDTNAVFN